MIIVTETRYLDGTGDVPKDVEYVKADNFYVKDEGTYIVRTKSEDDSEFLAFYVKGSYSKITLK